MVGLSMGHAQPTVVSDPAPYISNPIGRIRKEARAERALTAPLPPGGTTFSMARGVRFINDPLGLLLEHYRDYGPVFTLRLLTTPTVWMIGPEANHFLLVSGADHVRWRDGLMRELIPLVGDGLLTTDDEQHDRARRLIQPAFSRRAVEDQVAVMVDEADLAIAGLRAGEDLDVYLWTRRLALGIALRGLFGIEADVHRRDEVAERFESALSFYYRQAWWQLLRGPGTPFDQMQRQRRALVQLVLDEIAQRRRTLSDSGEDVLSRLLRAQDGSDRLTDLEITDQVLTLMFAGHDTTTSTISFMLYELARHPQELQLLQAEIEELVGDGPPSPPLLFDGLPRLEAVLAETLRLYPAAWYGPRRVARDFQFAGQTIGAGMLVHSSSWATHRLPHLYPDPEAFLPERFLSGAVAKLPKGSYIPFGAGTRICVGKRFGELEIKAIAVRLLQRFRPELQPGYRMTVRQAPTLSPRDGMPVTLRAAG
jgi:cytochrome P450